MWRFESASAMILGSVSWLDCLVFLIFLTPQLILQVGFLRTLWCGIKALPFLGMSILFEFLDLEYYAYIRAYMYSFSQVQL